MNDEQRFHPERYDTFVVSEHHFDPALRQVSLHYRLTGPEVAPVEFTETVAFMSELTEEDGLAHPGFLRALLHLHVAAGVSYYKCAAPGRVVIESGALSEDELALHRHLYDDGLREFAVANQLPVPHQVSFQVTPRRPESPPDRRTDGGLLVPIGGGKDSMVLIEATSALAPLLFAVNPHPLVIELARISGRPLLNVRRRLDGGLASLNARGARNGHVPITAIVSLIAIVGSFLYGYDAIAMAVERSASEETSVVAGVAVNHQYSKSIEFERLLAEVVQTHIDPGLVYGSGLRPYSELAIARGFARLTEFHATFCSCNTVFRQGAGATARWCGNCPKCRFVGLMLAPYLTPSALSSIIGRDMFADDDQIPGFLALMSDVDKPYECVGERRESAAAARLLAASPQWRQSPVVAALAPIADALVSDDDLAEILAPRLDLAFALPAVADAVERFFGIDR